MQFLLKKFQTNNKLCGFASLLECPLNNKEVVLMTKLFMSLFMSFAIPLVSSIAADAVPGGALTFGSPAPPLFLEAFVRGEAVKVFTPGTSYVVEFSGTTCRSCIRLIPEMNALQEKHLNVVFLSVFGEPEHDVIRFLKGPGKNMAIRVAVDTSGRMHAAWSGAANQNGIPHVFVVNSTGTIAWIGNPANLAEPLTSIISGTYDGRPDRMRLELKRALLEESRRRDRMNEELNAVQVRSQEDFPTAAASIEFLNKSLERLKGYPDLITLSTLKLDFYRDVPGSRDEAYDFAMSAAVDALKEPNPSFYLDVCSAMLSHYEHALTENKDDRLVDLAFLLLTDRNATRNHFRLSTDGEIDYQIKYLRTLSRAYRLCGDQSTAIETLKKAIIKAQTRDMENKPQWFVDTRKRRVQSLEVELAKLIDKTRKPLE